MSMSRSVSRRGSNVSRAESEEGRRKREEEKKKEVDMAAAAATAVAEAKKKEEEEAKAQMSLEMSKLKEEEVGGKGIEEDESVSTLLSASSGVLSLRSNEIEARTDLVLSSLDMLTHHIFALVEEFGIRSHGSGTLGSAVRWCVSAIQNSSADFMSEIGISGFWEGKADGRLWLKGEGDILTSDDNMSVQSGEGLISNFIKHGSRDVQTHTLPCYGYIAGEDLKGVEFSDVDGFGSSGGPHLGGDTPRGGRVRAFSTGVDTPHNIHTPRNYNKGAGTGGKAFFASGRTLPPHQGVVIMMLLPVFVGGSMVGVIRIVKNASNPQAFGDDESVGAELNDEPPTFTAIEESLYYSLSLMAGSALAHYGERDKAISDKSAAGKVEAATALNKGRSEGRLEAEGILKPELAQLQAERDRIATVFTSVLGESLDVVEGGLELDKCVTYYKGLIQPKTPQPAYETPLRIQGAGSDGEVLEFMKTILSATLSSRRDDHESALLGAEREAKVERLERQIWSLTQEKDRLAGLVTKLGTDRAIYLGYNNDYRSTIQRLTEDVGTLSNYSKYLEGRCEKLIRAKRRAEREVDRLGVWRDEGERVAEVIDEVKRDLES